MNILKLFSIVNNNNLKFSENYLGEHFFSKRKDQDSQCIKLSPLDKNKVISCVQFTQSIKLDNSIIKMINSPSLHSSSSEQQQYQNNIYSMLPEARPLQNKQIPSLQSLFSFVGDSAPQQFDFHPEAKQLNQLDSPMENGCQERSSATHIIGGSLVQLFQSPVYQSYEEVQFGPDNSKFATCAVKYQKLQQLKPSETKPKDDSFLIFQSRFECGNLAIAARNSNNENQYYLAMQRDTNSRATCQWYYFSVENRQNLGKFTFSIVNMIKNYSAYENGMKPCVLSVKDGEFWKRDGFQISYRKNTLIYRGQRNYYTFQFSYNFHHKNDKVYFAYSYPYTFTRLQHFLFQIEQSHKQLVKVKNLASTITGNPVNIVSITNPTSHSQTKEPTKQTARSHHKKIVKDLMLICARVHPGETNSSFACESLINFLAGNSEEANSMRTHFVVKVIPFLNPDGVIHGNYRTSISGHDLNRRWKKPEKDLHPQIYSIKKYLTETNHPKALFIDLHGHSKKRSSFMYGCLNKQNPYICKELPFILSKNGHHFCYFNCNFTTPPSREGTSRINLWKQFGVDYSYTMEISFCGPVKSRQQFTIKDYKKMGTELGRVISIYFCGKKYNSNSNHHFHHYLKQLYDQNEYLNEGQQQSQGSDSGEQQMVAIPDKKQQKTANSKQSQTQLKGILNKYLNETKLKWNKNNQTRNSFSQRKQQRMSKNFSHLRKQLAPSRISIQKIDLSQQVNNPFVNFTFSKGNLRLTSRDLKSNKFISKISSSNRNSYAPYSSSKSKSHRAYEQHSLMLPKVLRDEQLKYIKYRTKQCRFEISLSHEQKQKQPQPKPNYRNRNNSRLSQHNSRQISLAEKIFQNTHRQLQEAGRYWVRNN